MAWWGWIVVGVILLGSELALIDAQFYFVFLGIAALLVGFVVVAGVPLAVWMQWMLFGALSIIALGLFRKRLYGRLRGALPEVTSGPLGEILTVSATLGPGERGRSEYRGSVWTVYNDGEIPIDAGGNARIVGIDGVTLRVKKA
jgi:membrane protein implicated in regulation of membrane protease activity